MVALTGGDVVNVGFDFVTVSPKGRSRPTTSSSMADPSIPEGVACYPASACRRTAGNRPPRRSGDYRSTISG
jgi:hypothetical protein